jgi:hypothetical protein
MPSLRDSELPQTIGTSGQLMIGPLLTENRHTPNALVVLS